MSRLVLLRLEDCRQNDRPGRRAGSDSDRVVLASLAGSWSRGCRCSRRRRRASGFRCPRCSRSRRRPPACCPDASPLMLPRVMVMNRSGVVLVEPGLQLLAELDLDWYDIPVLGDVPLVVLDRSVEPSRVGVGLMVRRDHLRGGAAVIVDRVPGQIQVVAGRRKRDSARYGLGGRVNRRGRLRRQIGGAVLPIDVGPEMCVLGANIARIGRSPLRRG